MTAQFSNCANYWILWDELYAQFRIEWATETVALLGPRRRAIFEHCAEV